MRRIIPLLASLALLFSACDREDKGITDIDIEIIDRDGDGDGGEPGGSGPDLTFSLSANSITLGQSTQALANCPNGVPPLEKDGDWEGLVNALTLNETITPTSTGTFTYTLTCKDASGASDVETRTLFVTSGPGTQQVVLSPKPFPNIWAQGCPSAGSSTQNISANMQVNWLSSNPSVASVAHSSGTATVVTGHTAGTVWIKGISVTYGTRDSVQVTVNACPPPSGQVTSVEVVPPGTTCVVGNHATFSAVVHSTGSVSSTAVEWDVPTSSVASVVTRGSNTLVLGCNTAGSLTVTARAVADPSKSDTGVLTVVNPPAPSCPSTINYSPTGGSLTEDQTRALAVTGWPSGTTSCLPFWYLDRPDIAQVAGADNIITIDGTQYYAGINAILRGVSPGTVIVCVQTSIVTPEVKRCYQWTITAASSDTSPNLIPLPEVAPKLLYMDVEGVSQTYQGESN